MNKRSAAALRAWGEMAKACAEAVAKAREAGVRDEQIEGALITLQCLATYQDDDDDEDDEGPEPSPSPPVQFSVN